MASFEINDKGVLFYCSQCTACNFIPLRGLGTPVFLQREILVGQWYGGWCTYKGSVEGKCFLWGKLSFVDALIWFLQQVWLLVMSICVYTQNALENLWSCAGIVNHFEMYWYLGASSLFVGDFVRKLFWFHMGVMLVRNQTYGMYYVLGLVWEVGEAIPSIYMSIPKRPLKKITLSRFFPLYTREILLWQRQWYSLAGQGDGSGR